MKYLGVDWGKRSVGLAISEGILSSPLKDLEVSSLKDGVVKVYKVIQDEKIDQIIIGIPESGEAKSMAEKALVEFKKLGLSVVGADETLSTQNATQVMRDFDLKGSDHKMAAAIILQEYLDYVRP